MKKSKFLIVPIVIVLLIFAAYFLYGSTMINIKSEKSISNNLSSYKNTPISIIDLKVNDNYAFVLYTDPIDVNDDVVHYTYMRKHNLYKNRYKIKGGGKGNSEGIDSLKAYDCEKDTEPLFFVYSQVKNTNVCSVFEYNLLTGELVKKLDEFKMPQNSYVIVKKFDLEDKLYNDIIIIQGSVSFEEAINSVH